MTRFLLVIATLVALSVPAWAQYDSNQVRKVASLPATCTVNSTNAVVYQGMTYHCTATNTWSNVTGTVTDATGTVSGKAKLGQLPTSTYAGLPTCAAGNDGQLVRVTDANRDLYSCNGASGKWVSRNGGVYDIEDFGAKPSNSAAANDTAIAATVAACTDYGTIIAPAGNYAVSAVIALGDNRTFNGAGINATTFTRTGAGFVFSLGTGARLAHVYMVDSDSLPDGGIDLTASHESRINDVKIHNFRKSGAAGVLLEDTLRADFQNVWLTYCDISLKVGLASSTNQNTTIVFRKVNLYTSRSYAIKTYASDSALTFEDCIIESSTGNIAADFSTGNNFVWWTGGHIEDNGGTTSAPIVFKTGAGIATYSFKGITFSQLSASATGALTDIYASDNTNNVTVEQCTFTQNTAASRQFIRASGASTALVRNQNSYYSSGVTATTLSGYFSIASTVNHTVTQDNFHGSGSTNLSSGVAFGNTLQLPTVTATYGATTTLDLSASNIQALTLTGNITTLTASSIPRGPVWLALIQDGTGGRVITAWDSLFLFAGGTKPSLSVAANATDQFQFICNGSTCTLVAAIYDIK